MAVKFQLRRDTAANWTANNPILSEGEPGVETDTLKFKIGDGTTAWTSLDYAGGESDFNELLNKPTTLSGYGITDAATSSQGSLADSAVQPGDLASIATSGSFNDLGDTPTTLSGYGITDAATSSQGSLADSAIQPSDNISELTNDAGFITSDDIPTDVSSFTNDSGYLTSSVFGSAIAITDTTASTSTTTGALKISGGAGVAGALYAASVGVGTGGSLTIESSQLNLRSTQGVYFKPNGGNEAIFQFSTSELVSRAPVKALSYTDTLNSAGVSNAGGGVWTFNATFGTVFLAGTASIGSTFTANLTNLPVESTDQTRSAAVTMLLEQSTVPYLFNVLQIDGTAQTIKWLGGVTPSATSNSVDIVSLLIYGSGSSGVYNVLGSVASYG